MCPGVHAGDLGVGAIRSALRLRGHFVSHWSSFASCVLDAERTMPGIFTLVL